MSKVLSNLPPPLLAVLAVGAVWWLSQRRAAAAPGASYARPLPVYGTEAAVVAGRPSLVSASGVTPVAANPVSAFLGFAQSLINAPRPTMAERPPAAADYAYGGPSVGTYGAPMAPGQIPRPESYVPTWTPDTAGEDAARDYYLSNMDEFAAQPSPVFWTEPVPTTGGYLDSQ